MKKKKQKLERPEDLPAPALELSPFAPTLGDLVMASNLIAFRARLNEVKTAVTSTSWWSSSRISKFSFPKKKKKSGNTNMIIYD
jgi:hypothetical protein